MSRHTCCTIPEHRMPSVQAHLLHASRTCEEVSGLVAVFVLVKQDPWSWIVAILQDRMPSDITHLLHTFMFYLLSRCMAAGLLLHMHAGVHGLTVMLAPL